ncbi:alpha/beta fold hydrolase BchO [Planktotalea sp.]|uniref:alpha/beta fold hydrolase BchO n=1 Tax=Planktotalea sp. TaxID=2029877 RepID=UPI0025FF66CC|nr:alpha/beta fold hydrolase BchO [Planktotalea sp.]
MDWAKDSATWPNTAHSRFVSSAPHRWHVQDIGDGPLVLLLHGAGGATHSWQHLTPLLQPHFRVVVIDLPGQGFTKLGAQQRCGLDAMAEDILTLCRTEQFNPYAIIGHSAGAAIALRMAELMAPDQPKIIGINAALEPFAGVAGVVFPLLAKAIAALPLAADFFSATSSRGQGVEHILKSTGSNLPKDDIAFYKRLVASRSHVNATLQMMAQWSLNNLIAGLPQNGAETLLIAGKKDTTVPPKTSRNAAAKMPNARFELLPNLGHLAHEEDAERVATIILEALAPLHIKNQGRSL